MTLPLSERNVDGYDFLGAKRRGMVQQASDDILGGTDDSSNDRYRVSTLCCGLLYRVSFNPHKNPRGLLAHLTAPIFQMRRLRLGAVK